MKPRTFVVLDSGPTKTTVVFSGPRQVAQLAMLSWLRETAEQTKRVAR